MYIFRNLFSTGLLVSLNLIFMERLRWQLGQLTSSSPTSQNPMPYGWAKYLTGSTTRRSMELTMSTLLGR